MATTLVAYSTEVKRNDLVAIRGPYAAEARGGDSTVDGEPLMESGKLTV